MYYQIVVARKKLQYKYFPITPPLILNNTPPVFIQPPPPMEDPVGRSTPNKTMSDLFRTELNLIQKNACG